MIRYAFPLAALALAGALAAQQPTSVVFATSSDEIVLDGGAGLVNARLAQTDEAMIVTPVPFATYSARAFLSKDAQWAFGGDLDQDVNGSQVDSSSRGPGGDIDAIMVKRLNGPSTFGARDLYFSFENSGGSTSASLPGTIEDGDVFRFVAQGQLDVFVTEVQLLDAFGQTPTSDIDVDAICQTANGDLFLSCDFTETVNSVSVLDGGIVYIPTSAITYDASGNVSVITTGSAVAVIAEADVIQMVLDSGFKTSVGGDVSTSFELSALEVDPNGGFWLSPIDPNLSLPNILFGWSDFSNDGGIISTATNGVTAGSIPSINTVPMASTVATTGTQIGMLPDSSGLQGLAGLALVPMSSPQPVAELYPTDVLTSSSILWSQIQVSNATPNGILAAFVTAGPSGMPGDFHPTLSVPGFGGEVFGQIDTYILLGGAFADAEGFAAFTQTLPPITGLGGFELVFQILDVGSVTFATPAPMKVL